MEEIALTVEARDQYGTGPNRRLRQSGKIPGIFYGPKSSSVPLQVDRKHFTQNVESVEGAHLIRFQSSAADLQQRVVLVRETQVHPVSGSVLHVDFYEVDLTKRLQVTVPLHFTGRARGVVEGGILQPVLRDIVVECLPTEIPQFIEVDVTGLAIHDSLHLADLACPANVTPVFESNDAVVTVLAPMAEETKAAGGEGEDAAPVVEGEAPAADQKDPPKDS